MTGVLLPVGRLPLQREPVADAATRLLESPAPFLSNPRNPDMYAHIPRAAWAHDSGYTSVRTWCGQGKRIRPGHAAWLDDPAGHPVCGTCLGRFYGIDDTHESVTFAPRRDIAALGRRRWCPGAHVFVELPGRQVGVCAICGYHGRIRGGYRGYGWTDPNIGQHAPLTTHAVNYCPRHGWRTMQSKSPDRVRCVSFQCDWTNRIEVPS